MPFRLVLPQSTYEEMLAHAQAEQPNECVGILAGVLESGVGRVVKRYPLINAQASPTRYNAEAAALFGAHRDMREQNLDMLAVYHSHPTSRAVPSATDHELWAHGPAVVCLIVTLLDSPPTMRGWRLDDGEHQEAEWEVV